MGIGVTEVVGRSTASRRLDQAIERIARSEQNVLVVGESGTGKELVARGLHASGRRCGAPFVTLNCGAVPRQLMESELFGHEKGAFTGAGQKRLGLFEAASGGTLFLDEVGELPLELQPAMLRAVQFGEIRPVGSDRIRQVDVRVIAATHRDLRILMSEGRFREDPYYRLAVLDLQVPPLRERREDIALLAEAFLQRESSRAGRLLSLSDEAVRCLTEHDWPGNVRELENAIVRLTVLANGPVVAAQDVAELAFGRAATPSRPAPLPSLDLRELELLAIAEAMQQFGGNKRKASEALGISLKSLYNRLSAAGAAHDDHRGD
jgi:DNA-binding NtrC family response regulator